MKTAMEKMVNYLEEDNGADAYHKGSWAFKTLEYARSLLAEEQARKLQTERQPLAQDGLREALVKIKEKFTSWRLPVTAIERGRNEVCEEIHKLLSHHPAPTDEPLDKLADRKGCQLSGVITVGKKHIPYGIQGWPDTQEEAESKARQFLMALKDKKEGK